MSTITASTGPSAGAEPSAGTGAGAPEGSRGIRIQPIVFTRRVALWRDLLETVGLRAESGDDVFAVYAGDQGSVAIHALHAGADLPEGTVKLAWTVPDLEAFRRDAEAAGCPSRVTAQSFGDELHVEVPGVGWIGVTEEAEPPAPDAGGGAGVSGGEETPRPSLRVLARVDALDIEAVSACFEALGWSPRFRAVDGHYASLASHGLLAVSRQESALPTVGGDATALLSLETDTPRTEADRLGDLGVDVALTEQSWGWAVSVPTPSDWPLRLVQPPLDDPAYEYADPAEQAAADQVAVDG